MKLGIIGNLEKPELTEAVRLFIRCLEEQRTEYILDEGIAGVLRTAGTDTSKMKIAKQEECVSTVDILAAFGGDGTILWAARNVGPGGTPILGINLGKLGFLAEVAPSEIEAAVLDLINNRFEVEERLVLEATSPGIPGKVLHAVNDVVVGKARSSRMLELETYIDGTFAVNYRGDGLIISTPTGSTAYALSNGGPIVIPTSSVLGLTPISPHTLSGRPLIVPDHAVIRIVAQAGEGEVLLFADGQEEAVVGTPMELVIRKADYRLHLLKRSNRSYFDVLRAKLHWGRDPRSK